MNNTIRQYFQVVATCTATDPSDPKCECWHDIGTGPDPERTEKNSKGSWRDRPLEMDSETAQFHHHAARAFFASAWSDQREEAGKSTSGEIMDQMPPELDPEALNAASSLLAGMRLPIPEMLQYIREHADGDRQPTAEMFGHYAAMQAMGHGVGLNDAFGSETAEWIWGDNKIYMEFSGCALSKDYFEDEGEIEPKEPEFRTLDEEEDIDIFAGLEETEFPQSGPPSRPCPESFLDGTAEPGDCFSNGIVWQIFGGCFRSEKDFRTWANTLPAGSWPHKATLPDRIIGWVNVEGMWWVQDGYTTIRTPANMTCGFRGDLRDAATLQHHESALATRISILQQQLDALTKYGTMMHDVSAMINSRE